VRLELVTGSSRLGLRAGWRAGSRFAAAGTAVGCGACPYLPRWPLSAVDDRIHYLLTDEGDQVQPVDDMHDAQYHWWAIEALTAATILFHRSILLWIFQRAMALYRC
jgi:hypothetical protein